MTLHRIRSALRSRLKSLWRRVAGEPEWKQRKRAVDLEFDTRFHTITGGDTALDGLGIEGDTWRDGVRHIASDPDEFDAALHTVPADVTGYTFVDLGAGKGRAMLLASRYPFAKIMGVEFAEELLKDARRNLAQFKTDDQKCSDFECVHADATLFNFPVTDLVVFLYNPFNDKIMDTVAQRLYQSLRESPRAAYVVYVNPFHRDSWIKAGFATVAKASNAEIFQLGAD